MAVLVLASCDTGTQRKTASSNAPTSPSATSIDQTSPPTSATGVVFDAVETLPEDPMPGGQLVFLGNNGVDAVDIECWSITSKSLGQTSHVIGISNLVPGAAVRLFADAQAIDSVDQLTLSDRDGHAVDSTPRLVDKAGDDRLWYRVNDDSWKFGRDAELPDDIADARLAVGSQNC